MGISARGGLEPHFRVLFSAIFQGVTQGNFHQGRNLWKGAEAKVWSFVADLDTNFLCVLMIVASPRESEESQDNAVLSQGINDRGQRFQTQTYQMVSVANL